MNTPTPKQLRLVTVALALLGTLAAGYLFWRGKAESSSAADAPAGEDVAGSANDVAPVRVEVAPARMGDLVMRISTTGLTRARREITVAPKVTGEIVRLPIAEGQFVQKGQLLLKLDDREYRLALAEARDRLVGAQAEFRLRVHSESLRRPPAADTARTAASSAPLLADKQAPGAPDSTAQAETTDGNGETPLSLVDVRVARRNWQAAREKFLRGALSEEAYLKATLDYETARIISGQKREEVIAHKTGMTQAALAVQRAELNLSYTELRAPFSGYIADLQVQQGEQVSAGKECFKLVDLSQIEVELQVLESEVGLVRKGRRAEVTFPAYPGETFSGRVVHVNPVVDPETKTTKVTVRLDNPDRRILPGMFAYAKLEAQIFKNRFLVPKDAILIRDQRKLVFVVRDGLAKWCYVDTGLENEEFVEILDSTFGLKPGEMVITSGHYTLVHDARVRY